mmetsp:Transcript_103531/g.302119  ORF Transcript_103531/g.302119 Transcript_103531/m.302119 type:complete len:275 (-) Transcript_103531:62-886(-)
MQEVAGFEDGPEPSFTVPEEAEVSPLAYAARAGDLEEVQRLLAHGEDPNVFDSVGETPLFEAAASGNVSVAAALLLAGADPEWQSRIGGVPADLADEDGMAALLKICCGEEITEEEQNDILAACVHQLRHPVLCFIRSLTGEDEAIAMRRMEEEAFLQRSRPALLDGKVEEGSSSSGWGGSRSWGTAVKDVEIAVTHAITETKVTVTVPSNVTFGDVKKAILDQLDINGRSTPNIYLVRKERDTYQAYKDKDYIGNVRAVKMVGASLNAICDKD